MLYAGPVGSPTPARPVAPVMPGISASPPVLDPPLPVEPAPLNEAPAEDYFFFTTALTSFSTTLGTS